MSYLCALCRKELDGQEDCFHYTKIDEANKNTLKSKICVGCAKFIAKLYVTHFGDDLIKREFDAQFN